MEGLTVIEMIMLIVGSLGAGYMIPEVLFKAMVWVAKKVVYNGDDNE